MRGVLDIPDDLRELQSRLESHMERVERVFNDQLLSDLPPVDAMCAHVERYRGKMLRPTLVLLCGYAAGGPVGETHDVCAAVCEMVHMATLVHDDVLDEAEIRRSGRTINSMEGNETSVILGDYLIASAYDLCASLESPVPSRIVGRASATMCTGELLQLHNRNNLSLDEDTYFEILRRKTAALIGASCELGAIAALGFDRSNDPITQALKNFGIGLGVAFQIQDDVLDLTGTTDRVGKSVGRDLDKGKLTFPIIHHLATADVEMRGRSLEIIRDHTRGASDDTHELLSAIRATKSLEATKDRARTFVEEAKRSLGSLPETAAKPMLELMADAVIDRSF